MAKWFFTCQTLIVCLFVYFRISLALGQSEFHRYEFEHPYDSSDQAIDVILLDESKIHSIHRRDATTNSTTLSSNITGVTNSSVKAPTQGLKKLVAVHLQKSLNNASGAPVQYPLTKNLGENGTGIRLNYTSTKPPSLHINPINNATASEKTSTHVSVNKSTTGNIKHDDEVDVDGDLGILNPSDLDTEEGNKKFNESLSKHNVTSSKTDPNLFYNTTIILDDDPTVGHFYWVDLLNYTDVQVNDLLSHSHRRAATVKLSFNFPFYGHLIKNVTIATGGFLYTGDYVHSWLAATQYIAPLMANFDTSLSNDSFIKYLDNGTAFTVEWEKVTLQDKPDDGPFTFQVTLFNNGDIVFVYKHVPLLVDQIQELNHPVKVGLSDAYIMDQTVFLVRRKTIYEYDRVNFNKTYIKNWTTILLKALPTCLDARDCTSCLSRKLNFECFWCPAMAKCSQGYDRHRQNWLAHGCDKTSFSNVTTCSAVSYQPKHAYVFDHNSVSENKDSPKGMALAGKIMVPSSQNDMGMSGILAILFLVAMVCGLTFWVFYAYRNPHTTSGQILIRYRPTQWRWRRGEARYTAATIHM